MTTILSVRVGEKVVIAGDGQVSLGHTVLKGTACKIKALASNTIYAGFAGSTADALTLFDRLESKLEQHSNQLVRSCVELAKDWRKDKYLRSLEAMLIVIDKDNSLLVSGNGDVIEPEHGAIAIGSGGNYALAAARALLETGHQNAEEIAEISMKIASDICIYSNNNITIKVIENKAENRKNSGKKNKDREIHVTGKNPKAKKSSSEGTDNNAENQE